MRYAAEPSNSVQAAASVAVRRLAPRRRALLSWYLPRALPYVQVPGQKVGLIAARRTGQIRGRKEVDDRDKK